MLSIARKRQIAFFHNDYYELSVRLAQCAGEWAGAFMSILKSRRKEGWQNPKQLRLLVSA